MTDAPRCATCKWWNKTIGLDEGESPLEDWGWCDVLSNAGINDHDHRGVLIHPKQQGLVAVRAEFGCVLHIPFHIPGGTD